MNHSGVTRVALLLVVASSTLAAQLRDALPRFQAGAALIQVDAYIAQDGVPVTDLGPSDLAVFEDDRPQTISNIKVVQPRNLVLSSPVSPAPDGALFVLFFDTVHLDPKKAERAQEQMANLINSVVGPHDRVGVMTPEISAQNITLTRSSSSVDEVLRDMSLLDQDTGIAPSEARERELEMCYPDATMGGVAKELIERRREQRTLRGFDDLVTFLEGRRDERKFVFLISEGWALHRPNEQLAALQTGEPRRRDAGIDACEAERKMLATVDGTVELRKLAQRANRANVSVYPVDPSGFGAGPITATADVGEATARQVGLRELAAQTAGIAVLTTSDVVAGVVRMRADLQPYYVLSYYSSNTNLDGRFRRVVVRVKREGIEVRARPGYLSLTEAEARAGGLVSSPPVNRVAPPVIARPSDRTASAAPVSVRMQAVGSGGRVTAIVELDNAVLKRADWFTGGSVRMSIEPERGGEAVTIEAEIEPGQQVALLTSQTTLLPGRYLLRAEMRSRSGASVLQGSVVATVPVATALAGTSALASHRGPGTGLKYERTADARFRRTERLQVEVPLLSEGVKYSARLLTRTGQAMPLVVTASERVDGTTKWAVGEVGLAPLAAGDYVFELSFAEGEKVEVVTYPFRVVP